MTTLVKILKDAQTMPQAFHWLTGMEIMEESFRSSYVPIEARKEFVILEDLGEKGKQVLHPYGSSIIYFIHNENPKRDSVE